MTQRPLEAYIGEGLTLKGSVSGVSDMDIDGRIEGNVQLSGNVRVGERGHILGPVEAENLSVAGRVRGSVQVADALFITESGRVDGDVRAARIGLDDGGQLDGSIDMEFDLPADLMGELGGES